jgi:hypothetical protein
MQPSTKARVGYGQGYAETTETVTPVVRLRSGVTVKCGRYLGSKEKPFAFVWSDEEETAAPAREIVIQVGKQGAWLWEGQDRIDLKTTFPGNREATRLVRAFEDWQRFFEKYYDADRPQRFFWGRYHQEGLALARRLQMALIDQVVMRYRRPAEDPNSREAKGIDL